MKLRGIFLIGLLIGKPAVADNVYHAIYEIKPHFIGFEKEFGEVLPFYEAAIKEEDKQAGFTASIEQEDREYLGIDTFDLNGDGTKEIFVWFEGRLACGANTCPFAVYQMRNKRLRKIFSGLAHDAPEILSSATQGYHDLAFFVWEYGKEFYGIYHWDGIRYQWKRNIISTQLK